MLRLGGQIALCLVRNRVAVARLQLPVQLRQRDAREGNSRHRDRLVLAEQAHDVLAVCRLDLGKGVSQQLLLQMHDLLAGVHVGELQIKAGEFGRVLVGVGLLGAENGTCLKDALQPGRHRHLLVELRRLRQIRLGVKVLDLKHLGAGLGGGGDQLGRVDFHELPLQQEFAQGGGQRGLEAEHELVLLAAQVDPAVVHARVDVAVILNGQRLGDGFDAQGVREHFHAAHLDVLIGDDLAFHRDDRVQRQLIHQRRQFGVLFLLHRDLQLAGDVADDKERHLLLVPQVLDKAGDAVARARRDRADSGSVHMFFLLS